MRDYRVHRELAIEELELRVTPVPIGTILNAQNPIYRFTDADGDYIMLRFSGPGQAEVAGGINGTNITGIYFSGTTGQTNFLMRDLNPKAGDNTLTAGAETIQTAVGESLGALQFIAPTGRLIDTHIEIGENLGRFLVIGSTANVAVNVNGGLSQASILGNASETMVEAGDIGSLSVTGDADECYFATPLAGSNFGQVVIGGNLANSFIGIGGNSSSLRVGGDMLASRVIANGSIDRVFIGGSLVGDEPVGAFGEPPEIDNGISVGVNLGSVIIQGDLFDAQIAAGENIGSILIGGEMLGGAIIVGSEAQPLPLKGAFFVDTSLGPPAPTGNLGRLTIQGSVVFSEIFVQGDLGMLQFRSLVALAPLAVGGNVGQYQVSGPQFITGAEIGGGVGSILFNEFLFDCDFAVQGNVGRMIINGTLDETEINIGGNLGQGSINGDLDEGGRKVALDESRVTVGGNAANLAITGALINTSFVGIGNHTEYLRIIGGILGGSRVEMQGSAGIVQIIGNIEEAQGPALYIGGRLINSMLLQGNVLGIVNISGGSRYAPITIRGDLSNELTASAFGDVSILGNFTGLIDAEDVGVGNTLLVKGPVATGVVDPYPQAFHRYIGYEPVVI
ncbi:MAG: hypothetical protein AB1696_02765 [Planctomycetota bacterium]